MVTRHDFFGSNPVCILSVSLDTVSVSRGEADLTAQERLVWQRISNPQKQRCWVGGRLVGKQAVIAVLKNQKEQSIAPTDIIIHSSPSTRPAVRSTGEINLPEDLGNTVALSISHSGRFAAAVAGMRGDVQQVGIDIEAIRNFSKDFVEAFLTETEYQRYEQLPASAKNEYATICWSVKEAFLKACGVGLRVHPRRIEVLKDEQGILSIKKDGVMVVAKVWWTRCYESYILVVITL
jgi:phosphopantetheinyl transferase